MAKLTAGHVEQIRKMREDGKKYSEITEFFKSTYGIKLFDSQIAAIMRGKEPKAPKATRGKKKKALKDKPVAAAEPAEEAGDEFVSHVRAAFAAFKQRFLKEVESVIDRGEGRHD